MRLVTTAREEHRTRHHAAPLQEITVHQARRRQVAPSAPRIFFASVVHRTSPRVQHPRDHIAQKAPRPPRDQLVRRGIIVRVVHNHAPHAVRVPEAIVRKEVRLLPAAFAQWAIIAQGQLLIRRCVRQLQASIAQKGLPHPRVLLAGKVSRALVARLGSHLAQRHLAASVLKDLHIRVCVRPGAIALVALPIHCHVLRQLDNTAPKEQVLLPEARVQITSFVWVELLSQSPAVPLLAAFAPKARLPKVDNFARSVTIARVCGQAHCFALQHLRVHSAT